MTTPTCTLCDWVGKAQRYEYHANRLERQHQSTKRHKAMAAAVVCSMCEVERGAEICAGCEVAMKDADFDISDRPTVRVHGVTRWSDT